MFSVVETTENGSPIPIAAGVQNLWLKNGKLYWPPGKNIDRKTPTHPKSNWTKHDYKLLKGSIGTFEEALDLEKMYENHRDSNSFREEQEKRKAKRDHPVEHILKKDAKTIATSNKLNSRRNPLRHIRTICQKKDTFSVSRTKSNLASLTQGIAHFGFSDQTSRKVNTQYVPDNSVFDNISDPILPDAITEQENNESLQSYGVVMGNHQNSESCFIGNTRTTTNLDDYTISEDVASGAAVEHETSQNGMSAPSKQDTSYNRLLDAIFEIKNNAYRERIEMEARIHSHLDDLKKAIMDISERIKNDDDKRVPFMMLPLDSPNAPNTIEVDHSIGTILTLNPFEIGSAKEVDGFMEPNSAFNLFEIEELNGCFESSPAPNTFDNQTGIEVNGIQTVVSSSIGPTPIPNRLNIQSETLAVEPHTTDGSDSESDSNSEEVAAVVASNHVQVDVSSDFESDEDSIPEQLPKKSATDEPIVIKIKPMGEKYRDENNYLYSRNNVGSSKCIYLRCMNSVKYNCPARAILKEGEALLTIQHSHDAAKKHADRTRFYEKLNYNCKMDPFEMPLKIHLRTKEELLALIDDPVDEGNLPNAKETRSFINSRLKENIPPLPKTIREFEKLIAQEKYQKRFAVSSGQKQLPFYRGVWESVKGEKSITFISETVLKLLNSLNNITLFMDGTFRALPYHIKFGQLYVIHLIYKGHCYPLAYVLMEKRTFTAYDSVFSNLKLLMPSVDVVKLMTDYEAATRKALRIAFPNARLSGCFFHYVQAIMKKAYKLNLLEDGKLKMAVMKVAALALLPNEFVEVGFNHIDEHFQRKKSQRWTKFRKYWKIQWASANISVFSLADRTNNFSESSNRTLNSLLKTPNPSIWRLIDILKLIEMEKSEEMTRSVGGQMIATRKREEVVRLESKIVMATKLFVQTQDVGAFLENVTYDENLLLYIKDHFDVMVEDDETDDTIIPNSFDIESDFRQQHPGKQHARNKIVFNNLI